MIFTEFELIIFLISSNVLLFTLIIFNFLYTEGFKESNEDNPNICSLSFILSILNDEISTFLKFSTNKT